MRLMPLTVLMGLGLFAGGYFFSPLMAYFPEAFAAACYLWGAWMLFEAVKSFAGIRHRRQLARGF
jgi:hypothetical protein